MSAGGGLKKYDAFNGITYTVAGFNPAQIKKIKIKRGKDQNGNGKTCI